MIGHIESYDPERQTGVIKSEEKFYGFHIEDWQAQVSPDEGDDVRFELNDGMAVAVNLVGAFLEPPKPVKYKYLTAALAFFLGPFGAHRFYLGFYGIGSVQLLLTVILVVSGFLTFAFLWSFIDTILILGGLINKDAKGRALK